MIDLDGRTGEGGGQLVRVAVGLAAVTRQAVRITNVRGNRSRGGGLKAQHVSAVEWLAAAADADVEGLSVGSATLVFRPRKRRGQPGQPGQRAASSPPESTVLKAATAAASTSLMLQAILPCLVFGGSSDGDTAADTIATPPPLSVSLHGGTHVAWAPSFDYLDQVLFPALDAWFGLRIDRQLHARGWSAGSRAGEGAGVVQLTVHPVDGGGRLRPQVRALVDEENASTTDIPPAISHVDATVLAPADLLPLLPEALTQSFLASVSAAVPSLSAADLHLRTLEDSGHDARVYVLLVAHEAGGDQPGQPGCHHCRRWGRDYLGTGNIHKKPGQGGKAGKKGKAGRTTYNSDSDTTLAAMAARIARRVVADLADEVARGGCGDSFLQDQVVVFQALAAGRTSFWRGAGRADGEEEDEGLPSQDWADRYGPDAGPERPDRATKPFGQGSLHTATARWVTAALLPVQWFRDGTECEGAGWSNDGI